MYLFVNLPRSSTRTAPVNSVLAATCSYRMTSVTPTRSKDRLSSDRRVSHWRFWNQPTIYMQSITPIPRTSADNLHIPRLLLIHPKRNNELLGFWWTGDYFAASPRAGQVIIQPIWVLSWWVHCSPAFSRQTKWPSSIWVPWWLHWSPAFALDQVAFTFPTNYVSIYYNSYLFQTQTRRSILYRAALFAATLLL